MVEVKNITFSYGRSAGKTLEDIAFDIQNGECVAVLGNNGAGKSTLLKCIDRIHPTRDGVVVVDGKSVFEMTNRTMAQHIAYVPQNAAAVELTEFDTVLLGRKPYIKWDATAEDRRIVSDIIHQMGLDSYVLRNVSELSGGEAQKVVMARALAQQPKFLLHIRTAAGQLVQLRLRHGCELRIVQHFFGFALLGQQLLITLPRLYGWLQLGVLLEQPLPSCRIGNDLRLYF